MNRPAGSDSMQEGVFAARYLFAILVSVARSVEEWRRIPQLRGAEVHIVDHRIDTGGCNVRILFQIVAAIEKRRIGNQGKSMRISTSSDHAVVK